MLEGTAISECPLEYEIQLHETVHVEQHNIWCCCCCLRTYSRPTPRDPMAAACQAPLSVGLSRREYWSGLPSPPPGVFPTRIEPASLTFPAWQASYSPLVPPGKPKLTQCTFILYFHNSHIWYVAISVLSVLPPLPLSRTMVRICMRWPIAYSHSSALNFKVSMYSLPQQHVPRIPVLAWPVVIANSC